MSDLQAIHDRVIKFIDDHGLQLDSELVNICVGWAMFGEPLEWGESLRMLLKHMYVKFENHRTGISRMYSEVVIAFGVDSDYETSSTMSIESAEEEK